jgi:hypothetical protein
MIGSEPNGGCGELTYGWTHMHMMLINSINLTLKAPVKCMIGSEPNGGWEN